jgi:hypothetical protein
MNTDLTPTRDVDRPRERREAENSVSDPTIPVAILTEYTYTALYSSLSLPTSERRETRHARPRAPVCFCVVR